jgi:hypothetical protein
MFVLEAFSEMFPHKSFISLATLGFDKKAIGLACGKRCHGPA